MDKTLEEYIRDAGLSKPVSYKIEPSSDVDDIQMDENLEFPTCTIEEIPPEPNSEQEEESNQRRPQNKRERWNGVNENDIQWRMDRHRMPALVRYDDVLPKKRDLRSKIYNRNNNGSIHRNNNRSNMDLRSRICGQNKMNPMAEFLNALGRQFQESNANNGTQVVAMNNNNQINGAMAAIGGILNCLTPTPTLQKIEESDVKVQSEIAELQLQRKKVVIDQRGMMITPANCEPEIIEEIQSVHTTSISMHSRFSNMTPMKVVL